MLRRPGNSGGTPREVAITKKGVLTLKRTSDRSRAKAAKEYREQGDDHAGPHRVKIAASGISGQRRIRSLLSGLVLFALGTGNIARNFTPVVPVRSKLSSP
jgi:hypothetical protein